MGDIWPSADGCHSRDMRELSVAEQRYQAVLAVISDGETVTEVAARFGVSRQTLHAWLGKYEAGGIENLGDRSHQVFSCPHQMSSAVEAEIAVLRTGHPGGVRGGSRLWTSSHASRTPRSPP